MLKQCSKATWYLKPESTRPAEEDEDEYANSHESDIVLEETDEEEADEADEEDMNDEWMNPATSSCELFFIFFFFLHRKDLSFQWNISIKYNVYFNLFETSNIISTKGVFPPRAFRLSSESQSKSNQTDLWNIITESIFNALFNFDQVFNYTYDDFFIIVYKLFLLMITPKGNKYHRLYSVYPAIETESPNMNFLFHMMNHVF